MISTIFAIVLMLHSAHGEANCSQLPDGNYEIGCKTYSHCQNGELTLIECSTGMVYSNDTNGCEVQDKVPAPCGLVRDCSPPIKDGRYADKNLNCTSYYTCHHHIYYGHNYCPPGTVFEDTMATCVWPRDAFPPCGTRQ